MNYIIKKHHRYIPDKALLADLRKTAKKLCKKHVGYDEYDKDGKYCSLVLYRRFGGWNAALIKAGLKVKKVWRISNDELLENLKRVWDTLGRQPSSLEMLKPLSRYRRKVYERHFGSWHGALSAFEKALKNGKFKTHSTAGNRKFTIEAGKFRKKPVKTVNVNKCMRFDIFKRDNYRCKICGASPANDLKVTLQVDHVIPASKGGETILSNLQTLCSDCNYGKGAKSTTD